MKKNMTSKIKELNERIKYLENELEKVRQDRKKFRDYFTTKFKWLIKINAENKNPDAKWLIEDMGKLFTSVNDWWW